MKTVIIASKNPVKIRATRQAFEKAFPKQEFSFEGIDVPSGVSAQPMNDEETYQGAFRRAKNAQSKQKSADFWVGLEGGIEEKNRRMEAFAWMVILHANKRGEARTSTFFLPNKVAELVKNGVELGHANDEVFAQINSKQKGGAVGILTQGLLNRTEYYEQAVLLALIPFLHPELY